jgi:hypothetical protein
MSRRFLDLAMVAASQGEATPASSVRSAMFGMSSRARKQYLEAQIKETEEKMRVAREVLADGAKDLTEQFEEVHVSARPKVAHDKKETDADDTPLAMPKADVEALRTPLTRTTALPFLTEFASTAESLDSKLVAIVTMTDEEWEERKGASAAKNAKLARWLRMCFDLGKATASNFKDELTEEGVLGDGREIVKRIRGLAEFLTGPDRDAYEERVENTAYFKAGMSESETLKATRDFVKDLTILGETNHATVVSKIIKKAKTDARTNKEGFKLLSTSVHDRKIDGKPPYTVKQLAGMIAARLAVADGHERSTALAVGKRWSNACFICGSKEHQARDCVGKCEECDLRCCQGAQGKVCAVKDGSIDIDKCTDGAGRLLDTLAKEKIRQKRSKRVGAVFSVDSESDGSERPGRLVF